MKKIIPALAIVLLGVGTMTACGSSETPSTTTEATTDAAAAATTEAASQETSAEAPAAEASQEASSNFDQSQMINVISREDGSGTRGAFIELFGVEEKAADGTKTDRTSDEASIVNKTDVMLSTVGGDPYSIGYVSLGSLNDSVKAVKIDGVDATAENVKNGTYAIARPFNIATKGDPTGLTKDFIDFIMSKEGQSVVSDSYIAVTEDAAPYAGDKPAGKIVVAGSSSVTPVMEKLAEAYQAVNPDATIEIQMSDSTAGMTGAIDGICDIGMASRELKDEEAAQLKGLAIAQDGIAVIVNPENSIETLSKDQVKTIFTGEVTEWSPLFS